jgi:beta-phosphoglucomutase
MPLNIAKVKLEKGKGTLSERDGTEAFAAWILSPAVPVPAISARRGLQAVLFDLDGVLVDTAAFHCAAWARLAGELGMAFDERTNHAFRGVGRMECLDKLLGEHGRFFAIEEKHMLADRKNAYYLEMTATLTPAHVAAGAGLLVRELKANGVRVGLVSASCNARLVLKLLGITDWFNVIVDGNDVKTKREGFLRAAEKLRVAAKHCVVVEDAAAGIKAAREAGMGCVGIGVEGDARVAGVGEVGIEMMERLIKGGQE